MTNLTDVIRLRVDAELRDRIRDLADGEDRSESQVIRRLLREALAAREQALAAAERAEQERQRRSQAARKAAQARKAAAS